MPREEETNAIEERRRKSAVQILNAGQLFIADAEALQEILEVAAPVLTSKAGEYRSELEKTLKTIAPTAENEIRLKLSEFHNLNRLLSKQARGHFLFRGHLLVALVSRFDTFISTVCRELLSALPSRLDTKTVSFADAAQFKDIEELRTRIILDEVDNQMRGSHQEQLEFLSSLANVPLGKDEPSLIAQFVEVTERRNCHIHSNGHASAQYVRACAGYNTRSKEEIKEGQRLNVGIRYLDFARSVLSELAFKISQTVVRKVFGELRELADAHVNEIGLQMLKDHREKEALAFFDFAVQLKGAWAGDDASRRIFVVNKAQALLRLGQREDAEKLLSEHDWSAAHPKFLMAIHVLKGEFDAAAKLMSNADLQEGTYRDWPLFEAFRQSDEFRVSFRQLFGHDFDQAALSAATEELARIENGDPMLEAIENKDLGSPQTESRAITPSLTESETAPEPGTEGKPTDTAFAINPGQF